MQCNRPSTDMETAQEKVEVQEKKEKKKEMTECSQNFFEVSRKKRECSQIFSEEMSASVRSSQIVPVGRSQKEEEEQKKKKRQFQSNSMSSSVVKVVSATGCVRPYRWWKARSLISENMVWGKNKLAWNVRIRESKRVEEEDAREQRRADAKAN